ncbi:hypothetical protein CJI97_000021 [Candidozyma auris]|nr:hypothetical protein CJI97_000021 [[Candida] auris]
MSLLWKRLTGLSEGESSVDHSESDHVEERRLTKSTIDESSPPISPEMDLGKNQSPDTSPEIVQHEKMDHSESGKRSARYATDPVIVNWSALLQKRAANVFEPTVEFTGLEGSSKTREAQQKVVLGPAFGSEPSLDTQQFHDAEPSPNEPHVDGKASYDNASSSSTGHSAEEEDPVEAEARMVRELELQRQDKELNRRLSIQRHQERKIKQKKVRNDTNAEMEEALKEIRHAERRHRKLERRKKKEEAKQRQEQEQWYIEEQEFLKAQREKEAAREAEKAAAREEKRLRKEAKRAERERKKEREREREKERERERAEQEKKRREEEKARERERRERERQRQREEAERERIRQEEEAERERLRLQEEEERERARQEEEARRERRRERRERRRERRHRERANEGTENGESGAGANEETTRSRRRRDPETRARDREERARERERRATERAIRQVQAAERAAERQAERRRRRALEAQAAAEMGPPPRDEYSTVDEDIPPYREKLHKYLDLVAYDERFAPVLRVNRYLVSGQEDLIEAINQFSSSNLLPKKMDLWNISHVDDSEYENMIPVLIPQNAYYENELTGFLTPDTRSLVS